MVQRSWPRAGVFREAVRCDAMPDEPTSRDLGDAAEQTTGGARSDDDRPGVRTPSDDEYHWHGPSSDPHPASEEANARPGGPYGPLPTYPGPYGPPLQGPYGPPPQGPYYGPPAQGPYYAPSAQGPYGPPPQGPYGPPPQGPYYGPPPPPPHTWPYPPPPPPPRPPLSPEERRRRTRRALAFGGVLFLAVGAGIGIGAAIAPTSPAAVANALVNQAIAAATRAGTYHYVDLSTVGGVQDDIKGDAAPHGGQQLIRQACAPVKTATTSRTSIFELRLVRGVVYFRGNLVAAVDELGVPAARAAPVAGKWVKVVKGDGPYHTFEVGITTRSNISQLRTTIVPTSSRPVPGSSPSATEVLGALFTTKKTGQTQGTVALVMDASSGLPRTLHASALTGTGDRYTLTWTFSRYGEKVHVVAPPSPVPYSSLHATYSKSACG